VNNPGLAFRSRPGLADRLCQNRWFYGTATIVGYRDSCYREIGKVRIGFFLLANAPVLTPEPEYVWADIESVGPRDDPVIDERLGEETFLDKRLGNWAVHVFDVALEIKFGYQPVFVGERNLEIAIGSH
jgi:hypothetical protein